MIQTLLVFLAGMLTMFAVLILLYANDQNFVKWWNDVTKKEKDPKFRAWIEKMKHDLDPNKDHE